MARERIRRRLRDIDPRLRLATADDVAAISRLLTGLTALEWPDLPTDFHLPTLRRLETSEQSFVVLCAEGERVIAVAAVHAFPDLLGGKLQVFVDDILVDLGRRREGLGTLVLQGVLGLTEELGAGHVFIHLDAHAERAHKLMAKGGLADTGDVVWGRTFS